MLWWCSRHMLDVPSPSDRPADSILQHVADCILEMTDRKCCSYYLGVYFPFCCLSICFQIDVISIKEWYNYFPLVGGLSVWNEKRCGCIVLETAWSHRKRYRPFQWNFGTRSYRLCMTQWKCTVIEEKKLFSLLAITTHQSCLVLCNPGKLFSSRS